MKARYWPCFAVNDSLKVRIFDSFGEDAFAASIDPAPKLDPSVAKTSSQ